MTTETVTDEAPARDSASLYFAIAAMAGVAACLVAITFSMFLQSPTYTTVKSIQANAKIDGSALSDYDTTSPVKNADIEETIRAIENKMNSLDNQENYGADSISDNAIGLER